MNNIITLGKRKTNSFNVGAYMQGIQICVPASKMSGKITIGKEEQELGITEDSFFDLNPNTNYDLNEPYVKYWIDLAIKQGIVAKNRADFDNLTTYTYYIFDATAESKIQVNRIEKKLKAMTLISDMTDIKRVEVLKVLGVNGEGLSRESVLEMLYEYAETPPSKNTQMNWDTLIKTVNDVDFDFNLLLADLIFKSIIRIEDGRYKYNELEMGVSKEDVKSFLRKPENADILKALKEKCYKSETKKSK